MLNARVRALDEALCAEAVPGIAEVVPAYASLLVTLDPGRGKAGDVEAAVRRLLDAHRDRPAAPGRLHEVPVAYGRGDGPDLEEAAARVGLTADAFVARHALTEYTVYFLGFAPGFAYMGDLPEALAVPRRATPRPRVPAGSVAVAGRQTAIYPHGTAGGWNLIGRTSASLFDPSREPAALFAPGDRVRFVPAARLAAAAPRAAPSAAGPAALEVLEPGLLTTVQDEGRRGHRRIGVAWAGAVDLDAHRRANAAVGNGGAAATLECTAAGPVLRFLSAARLAVAGADLGAVLERADLGGPWPVPLETPVQARPGNVLRFTGRRRGLRAYVALAGGLDVPPVLGSRSTDLAAGFGGLEGRPLRAGDRLAIGREPGASRHKLRFAAGRDDVATVRVVPGPQREDFAPYALERLLASTYAVRELSDRTACRLDGERLAHAGPGEIVTDGMVPGCIQVPPDGQPIVMLADCPPTGGYPKIATVLSADLPRLAQLVPGEGRVRFTLARR